MWRARGEANRCEREKPNKECNYRQKQKTTRVFGKHTQTQKNKIIKPTDRRQTYAREVAMGGRTDEDGRLLFRTNARHTFWRQSSVTPRAMPAATAMPMCAPADRPALTWSVTCGFWLVAVSERVRKKVRNETEKRMRKVARGKTINTKCEQQHT